MVRILPATGFSNDSLRVAMQDAFSDYEIPLQLNASAFDLMMQQRGLDRPGSRVALVDEQIAAIWLMAIRGPDAYLISSGTRPMFRARGMARALAKDCLSGLTGRGVRSLRTEVLARNETAAKLYSSLGMRRIRLLDCYTVPAQTGPAAALGEASEPEWHDLMPAAAVLHDWPPSWQNDNQSLNAIADRLLCVALSDATGIAGFAVATRETGTLHQIAVRKDKRRSGVGTDLIGTLQTRLDGKPLRLINVQQDDDAFRALMAHVGARKTVAQYELGMDL